MKHRIILPLALSIVVAAGCSNAGDASGTVVGSTAVTTAATPAPVDASTYATTAAPVDAPATSADPESTAETLLEDCPICEVPDDYSGPLSYEEVQGLLLALNDEYHAQAVYEQVLADHGDVTPFVNIRHAEINHADRLIALFGVYGLEVPENPWLGAVPSFDTVAAACAAGVDAEIVNATLYDYLYSTTDRADIVSVYERLQAASNDRHLPAFERCGTGGGGGRGNDPGSSAGA